MAGDQKEYDAAATCIQARFRGFRSRKQQRKVIAGVTKLQARQRGLFSRREFARLLQFSREQESFLRATERRQLRIWRNEQELYFLQHTTTEQLERIRDFQRKRGARAIQRAWREYTGDPPHSSNSKSQKSRNRPPIFTFDPFQLHNRQLVIENNEDGSKLDPQSLEKDLLGPLSSAPRVPPALLNREAFSQRRKNVQNRITQLIQIQTQKEKLKAQFSLSNQRDNDTAHHHHHHHENLQLLSPTKKQVNRRRELYDQLVHLKTSTARRVRDYESKYRTTRVSRELLSAKLGSSCENRLQVLQQGLAILPMLRGQSFGPSSQFSFSPGDQQQLQAQTARFQVETQQWDAERKAAAWGNHNQIVHATSAKQKWWQTSVAGSERDIRKVHAKSPFEHEKKVWLWPSQSSGKRTATTPTTTDNQPIEKEDQPHASELDAFVFSLERPDNQEEAGMSRCPEPMADREASEWWRAHCMQPHLVGSSSSYEANDDRSNNEDDQHQHVPSSEALANPVFHRLLLESQRRNRLKEHKFAVNATLERFHNRVNQRVGEIEMQIEVNTKLQQDMALRRLQIKKRRSKEENAVVSIQRVFRGVQGRKHASEVRAEYFVMVRGRAIRKGRCEECGEQQAVLECTECEESLHFCPVCWVQVHATRRRKTHIAIPMSVVPKERPVGLHGAATNKKAVEKPERGSGRDQQPALRGPGEAKVVGTGQAKPAASKRNAAAAESDAHVLTTTTTRDKSDRHLGVDDDGNKAFEQMEGGDGDSSCPPVVLEGDASTENVPAIAVTARSRIATESGGGATPTAAPAKPKQTPKTPTTSISKPTSSRLSLKQRVEKVLAVRIEPGTSTSDSKADDASSSIKGSSLLSLKDDATSSAGPLVQSGLKQPKSSSSSAEIDTLQVLGGGTGMADEDVAKATMKASAETVAAETVAPSEADDGDTPGDPVVKGRPAAAARLSLKQSMSGSSSVQLEARRSESAVDLPTGTFVDENSDSSLVQPATRDAATVAKKEPAGVTNLHEHEVSTPPPVVTASQTAEVGGDASITSATVEGKPKPGVKEDPKSMDRKGEEGLETKAAVPVLVAAPVIEADSEATASSLETSPGLTPADQVVAGSRSNSDG